MARPNSRVSGVRVTGPLVPFIDAYRGELARRGYTVRSQVNELRQVARLSTWLEQHGVEAGQVDMELMRRFEAWQKETGRFCSQWSRPGLLCLLDVLRVAGAVTDRAEPAASSGSQLLLARFERFLLVERALAAGTVVGYVASAERFLADVPVHQLPALSSAQVSAAVLARSQVVAVSTSQNFIAALRAFLRFCFLDGMLETDLSKAALAATGRRRSMLPWGISKTHAEAILVSCDRRTATGRRDYAMLTLLLRLGLRRSEVAGLRLDDIDWRAGELIVRGKGSRTDRLPLPADVGQAIGGYLRRGRPASDGRELFLRGRAPVGPIGSGTVASTVRRACRRAGIPEVGSHRLRHTVACEMVAAGVPLIEVGQVLRHHSLQTTASYARVDLDRLRMLALPWPESEPS